MEQRTFLLCGQTDSGKSTIAGHLLQMVGYFDEDEKRPVQDSVSKSKFSSLMDIFSDSDTLAVKTNKTKTDDFIICPFTYQGINYSLIDTPGHKLYIRSLIAGLYSIPVINLVCIVVSSDPEEFEGGFSQGTTKEDLLLARSVGCKNLLVVWNKIDKFTATQEMISNLSKYATSLRFTTVNHINVSGWEGTNLLDILKYVPEVSLVESVSVPIEKKKKITLTACFFCPEEVITIGYMCMIHHISGEYECEIIKMPKGTIFVKGNKPVKFSVKILRKDFSGKKGDRIILRKDTLTLAFGAVNE